MPIERLLTIASEVDTIIPGAKFRPIEAISCLAWGELSAPAAAIPSRLLGNMDEPSETQLPFPDLAENKSPILLPRRKQGRSRS
jgi:hypothetical protein